MSTTSILPAKKSPARNATPARPAPRPLAGVRSQAEDVLRELAFVYHAVRTVKQSMTAARA